MDKTPEEKVREFYNLMLFANDETFADIIKHTVDLLGIKIEGINS